MCRIWVQQRISCEAPPESEETLLAQCRSEWEDYPNRVAPCFAAEYGECAPMECANDDMCYVKAIVANDPSVVNIERFRACTMPPPAPDCDDLPAGFLKACLDRVDECNVFDDLCSRIATLKQPYRSEGEACSRAAAPNCQAVCTLHWAEPSPSELSSAFTVGLCSPTSHADFAHLALSASSAPTINGLRRD